MAQGSVAVGGEHDLMVEFERAPCSELPENLLIYFYVEMGEKPVTQRRGICP